jgi:phosphoribosylcarboxyaminoimidazole (NCAIR) mutase
LNRARIHDALANIEEYDGVTGHMIFDPNQKNVAPLYLGTVHDGAITYRVATMEKLPAAPPAVGQAPVAQPVPYARVGEEGVVYAGPHSADAAPGKVQAALAAGAANGRQWNLIAVASDQNWGKASTQLVKALMDEHALAIIALDRDAAHLAEQLALKTFVPVVALSNDKTLTSTNVPWIFRMPSATTPASALRLLEAAAARSGANAERLRDVLASGDQIAGAAFLPTGEPRVQ